MPADPADVESFAVLEPVADGFRNYLGKLQPRLAEHHLVDRASLLTLAAPEMTVLVGGLRALNANYDHSSLGILTGRPGTLTNDFFVNLLDMGTRWQATSEAEDTFEGRDRVTGELKWTGSRPPAGIIGPHAADWHGRAQPGPGSAAPAGPPGPVRRGRG